MSYPVSVTIQLEGGLALADFRSLTITQELFTHHTFALDFSFEALGKSLGIKPELLFQQAHEKLSGKTITIGWTSQLEGAGGRSFEFKGLVTETSIQTNADLSNYYHISGTSPTFLLEDGSQSRSFVKKTAQQIFTAVLADYPGNALAHQLKPRHGAVLPYVVQYDETNFNFLSRLAAQQGEWLYYDGTTFQLGLAQAKTVPFQSNGAQSFTLSMNLQPGHIQGSHYNYRAHQPLRATAKPPTAADAFSRFALKRSKELFTQPHRLMADAVHTTAPQLQQALDTLAAKQTSALVVLEGQGEAFDLVPGSLLEVRDAAAVDYGKFRVLAVEHELDADGNYQNRFKGMSGTLDSPPPNEFYTTPGGHSELAEVIDLEDPRGLGRIRVRYHWPVAKPADAESSWLRVSTPYSGDGKGQLFTPEKGSQVLVGYEHGLAEFPVVLGNLFHPSNKQKATYSTPDNHRKGLQTAGGNKVVMSDKPGEQTIHLSNSNNKGTAVEVGFKGDGSITIKSNGPVSILAGGDITLTAKKNIVMTAENVTINAKKKIVKTAKEIELTGSDKLDMNGKATSIKAGDTMKIAASSSLDVNGGSKASISSGKTRIH